MTHYSRNADGYARALRDNQEIQEAQRRMQVKKSYAESVSPPDQSLADAWQEQIDLWEGRRQEVVKEMREMTKTLSGDQRSTGLAIEQNMPFKGSKANDIILGSERQVDFDLNGKTDPTPGRGADKGKASKPGSIIIGDSPRNSSTRYEDRNERHPDRHKQRHDNAKPRRPGKGAALTIENDMPAVTSLLAEDAATMLLASLPSGEGDWGSGVNQKINPQPSTTVSGTILLG